MFKYIKYLLLYSLLLIHSCKWYQDVIKPVQDQAYNTFYQDFNGYEDRPVVNFSIDTEKKFDAFMHAFQEILHEMEERIQKYQDEKKKNPALVEYAPIPSYKKKVSKLIGFIEWISKDKLRQKELADNFTYVYNFLDQKRQLYSNNTTMTQYISNAFKCHKDDSKCEMAAQKYGNHHQGNNIHEFFYLIVDFTYTQDTYEKMFQEIIKELDPDKSGPIHELEDWEWI
ncbi:Mlp family lipoprotein [Borrelia persica]|uniref:Mlp family lipoprotein n=1 Tax=Borrelia persica TaxID=44448 RepID=UPI0004677628|nr:Mlp family lipoprotein [Borrelia persica]